MINAEKDYKYSELTHEIIGCVYRVFNALGAGFLEKVYENAVIIELTKLGMSAEQQVPIDVYYDEIKVGEYYADILVEDKVIIELKAATDLVKAHEVQLVNYLKATGIEVGLLINFGDEVQIKRRVLSKSRQSE